MKRHTHRQAPWGPGAASLSAAWPDSSRRGLRTRHRPGRWPGPLPARDRGGRQPKHPGGPTTPTGALKRKAGWCERALGADGAGATPPQTLLRAAPHRLAGGPRGRARAVRVAGVDPPAHAFERQPGRTVWQRPAPGATPSTRGGARTGTQRAGPGKRRGDASCLAAQDGARGQRPADARGTGCTAGGRPERLQPCGFPGKGRSGRPRDSELTPSW